MIASLVTCCISQYFTNLNYRCHYSALAVILLFVTCLGCCLGCWLGCWLGCCLGCWLGCWLGCCMGCWLGCCLGCCLGCGLGCCLGVFIPSITTKYQRINTVHLFHPFCRTHLTDSYVCTPLTQSTTPHSSSHVH